MSLDRSRHRYLFLVGVAIILSVDLAHKIYSVSERRHARRSDPKEE